MHKFVHVWSEGCHSLRKAAVGFRIPGGSVSCESCNFLQAAMSDGQLGRPGTLNPKP